MSRRTRRFALLAAGIAVIVVAGLTATFALSAHRSSQAAASTLYVGATAGANTSCASPGYTTVQSAVSAAGSRDTVYLCASGSPYTENVIVANKSLTLTGDTGATIAAPNTFNDFALPSQFASDGLLNPEAVLLVWGASANVAINGLTISGPFNNTIAGCGSQTYGVLVLSGATVALNGDNVTNISDPVSSILLGCQHGVAIQIGREYWRTANLSAFLVENFAGHASISGTTVAGYQKNGITVDGPGSSADVRGNTVNGSGRDTKYAPAIAQNGIQISRGASAQVRDNTVTGNSYTGPSFASSAGILLFGGCGDPLVTGVQVMGNTLINNDIGVAMLNYAADCVNPAGSMTNDKTIHNTISNDEVSNIGSCGCTYFPYRGYQAGIEDVGNNDKLINNDISGAGYAAQTTVGGPFVLPIDTTSSPTTNPKVHANK